MVMVIIGTVLLVIGLGLFFWMRHEKGTAAHLSTIETSSVKLLQDIHTRIVTTVGGDVFTQQCALNGKIECDSPLAGRLSQQACVAYNYSVEREYEETTYKTNDKGERESSVDRGSETLESGDKRTSFWLRDATGRVRIDPKEAEIELEEVLNRFDQTNDRGRGPRKTLGTRSTEKILGLGEEIFVLGYAIDRNGDLVVAKHPHNIGRFLISRQSKEALVQSAQETANFLFYTIWACGVAGVVLIVLGLIL